VSAVTAPFSGLSAVGLTAVGLTAVITAVMIILAGCVALLGIVIVTARLIRGFRASRRARLAAPVRPLVLQLAGEDETLVSQAMAGLAALDRRHWRAIEPVMVSLLGKVQGDLRTSLAWLFDERGVTSRATRDLRARGIARRARAAALLGDLANAAASTALRELLDDRSFAVRVASARALGHIGDCGAAGPMLAKLTGHRRIPPHIVAYALMRLGPGIRADLVAAAGHAEALVRAVAIEILGLIKAVGATEAVIEALLRDPSDEVRIRAARALGRIGMPAGVQPLLAAVQAGEVPALRAVAAGALGELGAAEAAPGLAAWLNDPGYHVAHNAARSLLRLGRDGEAALAEAAVGTLGDRAATHAQEALAMAALDAERQVHRPVPHRAGEGAAGHAGDHTAARP
jgi:HEAT repeat protein